MACASGMSFRSQPSGPKWSEAHHRPKAITSALPDRLARWDRLVTLSNNRAVTIYWTGTGVNQERRLPDGTFGGTQDVAVQEIQAVNR